jgi:hypothetical protein
MLLPELGVTEKLTHSSSLDDDLIYKIRKRFGFEAEEPPPPPAQTRTEPGRSEPPPETSPRPVSEKPSL